MSKDPLAALLGQHKPPVSKSAELTRILALPRRPRVEPGSVRAAALIEAQTEQYGRGQRKCDCANIQARAKVLQKPCITRMNYAQAWTLHELTLVDGVVANLAVGSGKCLAAGAEIFDAGSARRRDVAEPGALLVPSVDETGRAQVVRPATAFVSGVKHCVRLSLRDGSEVVASTDHPILTTRGWIPAAEVRETDLVAVASYAPEPANPVVASDAEIAFVAYMLSDGGCSNKNLQFTNGNEAVIADWRKCSEALGYRVTERVSRSRAREFVLSGNRKRRANDGRRFERDPVRARWDLHGLAKNKRAHADIWGLSSRQVALFLNRFWACDGHVSATTLEVTLASEKLVDDLKFLMLRLGVRSRKHYKTSSYVKDGVRHTFDAWRLVVYGADALRFLTCVGPVLGKEEACAALSARLRATKRNPNYDVVPVGPTEFGEICDELGYPRTASRRGYHPRSDARRALSATAGQYVSRTKFAAFCDLTGYRGRHLKWLIDGVAWERVRGVSPVGSRPVYDLNVPTTHNFVANGIVVHNTLLDFLAPLAVKSCKCAVLFAPSNLMKQVAVEYALVAEHFRVPTLIIHAGDKSPPMQPQPGAPVLHVLPYSRFQLAKSTVFLEHIKPDFIIVDEAQNFANMLSTRSSRFYRYMAAHPKTRLAVWSGTLTDDSIMDYVAYCDLALGEGSPTPRKPEVAEEWATALDPTDWVAPAGALRAFCNDGEHVQDGYHRRLTETLGFVTTSGASIDVELEVRQRPAPKLPDIMRPHPEAPGNVCLDLGINVPKGYWPGVETALRLLRGKWQRPDGEQLLDALAVNRCARELACGLFLRWRFIHGETVPLIEEWKAARKEWRSELKDKLQRREPHLDSPLLCANAAARAWGQHGGVLDYDDQGEEIHAIDGPAPLWKAESWPRWAAIRDKVKPVTEAVRLDDFLARDAAQWALENKGIVWYSTAEFGAWVAELSGLPQHAGGTKAEERIAAERGDRSIICSIKSHGTGRDGLQRLFSTQLVAQPPSSAVGWEQLMGRLSRIGQNATKVYASVYRHTPETAAALDAAMRKAQYCQRTMGQAQKLIAGWNS